jgi:hypothetical protein
MQSKMFFRPRLILLADLLKDIAFRTGFQQHGQKLRDLFEPAKCADGDKHQTGKYVKKLTAAYCCKCDMKAVFRRVF